MPFLVDLVGIIDLQSYNCHHLLSEFSSKNQSYMKTSHRNVRMQNIPNFVSIDDNLDELKISWDGIIYKLIHKKMSLE